MLQAVAKALHYFSPIQHNRYNAIYRNRSVPSSQSSTPSQISIDFSSIIALNNNANAKFRIYGINAGSGAGTLRIDDVTFNGCQPADLTSTSLAANLTGTAAGLTETAAAATASADNLTATESSNLTATASSDNLTGTAVELTATASSVNLQPLQLHLLELQYLQ